MNDLGTCSHDWLPVDVEQRTIGRVIDGISKSYRNGFWPWTKELLVPAIGYWEEYRSRSVCKWCGLVRMGEWT